MALDVPDGTKCFVDSNIFYYALVPTPVVSQHCVDFLNRAIAGRVSLTTTAAVLSDTIHKVMISEIAQLTGRDRAGMIGYLEKHPEAIKQLVEYKKAADRLAAIPMDVLPLDLLVLREATVTAVQHGLLTNDAIIVTLMQRQQLANLITNDDDFDRVPGLKIYKPR